MRFEKLMFKNTVKRLAKSQFDLKNCRLVFKILYLKKKKKKKNYHCLRFKKTVFCVFESQFLKSTIFKQFIFCDLV